MMSGTGRYYRHRIHAVGFLDHGKKRSVRSQGPPEMHISPFLQQVLPLISLSGARGDGAVAGRPPLVSFATAKLVEAVRSHGIKPRQCNGYAASFSPRQDSDLLLTPTHL